MVFRSLLIFTLTYLVYQPYQKSYELGKAPIRNFTMLLTANWASLARWIRTGHR